MCNALRKSLFYYGYYYQDIYLTLSLEGKELTWWRLNVMNVGTRQTTTDPVNKISRSSPLSFLRITYPCFESNLLLLFAFALWKQFLLTLVKRIHAYIYILDHTTEKRITQDLCPKYLCWVNHLHASTTITHEKGTHNLIIMTHDDQTRMVIIT